MQGNSIPKDIQKSIQGLQIQNKKMYFRPIGSHQLYKKLIKPILQKMAEGIDDAQSLLMNLREFKVFHQPKRVNIEKNLCHKIQEFQYTELKNLIDSQKTQYEVLPLFSSMANFILSQEEHFETTKIQILQQGLNEAILLTKEQVVYILCLMALNLVPLQDYDYDEAHSNRRDNFPKWNVFSHIFSTSNYKTNTVMAYFNHHLNNKKNLNNNETFTIRRLCLDLPMQSYILSHHMQKMTQPEIKSNHASIEEFNGLAKVDFANKYIGGGALHDGCVQEQIMFSNHPELFISGIFCEMMKQNQSIYLQGYRKYSINESYGLGVKYAGQQQITQQTFKTKQYVIAIDAIHFGKKQKVSQFSNQNIDRQLMKAYAGFSNLPQGIHVATGNWGCGVFNGDVRLKFLIQWLACSMTERKMMYCPFGYWETLQNNRQVIQKLKQKCVGDFYTLLVRAAQQMKDNSQWNIFQLINEQLQKQLKPKI